MRIDNQTGLALVTAMVFLVILSIIGISSMRNSTLEQSMSGNIQDQNHAFQLAESGIARTLSDPDAFDINKTGSTDNDFLPRDYNPPKAFSPTSTHQKLNVKTHYRGESAAKGESFREINTLGQATVRVFHVDSQARYNNAVAEQALGVAVIAPKSQ